MLIHLRTQNKLWNLEMSSVLFKKIINFVSSAYNVVNGYFVHASIATPFSS